jgi:2-amino-4-hydroxy-6-hydroxymethyldihydropteridine diphosphokinase
VETSRAKSQTYFVKKIVYLSLGSNVGDRARNLETALNKLAMLGNVLAVSSFYETEPVEMTAQPWFLNCAVKLETERMPRQLIAGILNFEQEMGRQRKQPKGPRTIDIDVLLFGSSIIEMKGLTVPHPRMHQRRFGAEAYRPAAARRSFSRADGEEITPDVVIEDSADPRSSGNDNPAALFRTGHCRLFFRKLTTQEINERPRLRPS